MQIIENYNLNNLKKELNKLKWFFLIYFIFSISFVYYQNTVNDIHMKITLVLLLFLFIIGCLLLIFITYKNLPIYKTAFMIILIFGVICVFLTPICTISDECEHFVRSELTSHGDLIPIYDYHNGDDEKTYQTIKSIEVVHPKEYSGKTVFETDWDTQKINNEPGIYGSAFAQNPFYGYIPQAIGIFIAKILDLNNIWMLWLGRLCNLIMYAGVCTYAIKKAPIYKNALFVVACLPLAIFQAASLSIDATVNSFGLLIIAYFLYMYCREENTLRKKDIAIFLAICLFTSLTKVTFLAFSLLIFLIPKNRFENNKTRYTSAIGFLITSSLVGLWSKLYANKVLLNSWRASSFMTRNVNPNEQVIYILQNPTSFLFNLFSIANIKKVIASYFFFGHGGHCMYESSFLAVMFAIFFIIFCFAYPSNERINKKTKAGLFLLAAILFYGTAIVQYLTWCPVGSPTIEGIYGRYLIPLLALGPMILGINKKDVDLEKFKILLITISISFISSMILLTFMTFY